MERSSRSCVLLVLDCGLVTNCWGLLPTCIPTDGLYARYDLTVTAAVISGNGHDGVFGGASIATDRCFAEGSAMAFSGDDHIELQNTSSFDGTTGFTLAGRVHCSDRQCHIALVTKHVNFYSNGSTLGTTDNFAKHDINNGSSSHIQAEVAKGDTQWHFFAATYDGDRMDLYVDAVLVRTMTGVPPPIQNAMNMRIGMESELAGIIGLLDDVGIRTTALTADQVAQMYVTCSLAIPEVVDMAQRIQVVPSVSEAGVPVRILFGDHGPTACEVLDVCGRNIYCYRSGTRTVAVVTDRPVLNDQTASHERTA